MGHTGRIRGMYSWFPWLCIPPENRKMLFLEAKKQEVHLKL